MTRAILLATSVALTTLTLSPSAFSAAVIHNGSLVRPGDAAFARAAWQRDLDRLHIAWRGDFVGPRLALANLGGRQTLSGVNIEVAVPVLALDRVLDVADSGVKVCPALPELQGGVSQSAAQTSASPAPPSDAVGSASAFAAVPEPSSLVLLGFGVSALLRRRRS